MDNPLYALAKGLGTVNHLIRDPGYLDERQAFDDLSQQQAAQAQPQGAMPNGQPMQAQVNPLTKYQMLAAHLASANPSAYGQQAMQVQDPLAVAASMSDSVLKRAEAENQKAEAQNRSVHPLQNGQMLIIHPDGSHAIVGDPMPQSEEGKKLQDLIHISQGSGAFQQQGGSSAGGDNPSVAPQPAPQSGMNQSIADKLQYALMTPDQQKAKDAQAEQRAKAIQEADQAVIENKAARDQMLPALNQMDVINSSGKLPSVMPEEQAAGSTLLQNMGVGTGEAADAVNSFKQLNGGNFTKGLASFFSSGNGMRMEKPIADAVMISNEIPMNVPQETRQKMVNQLRVSAYNATIAAQNKAAQLRDPNAPVIPELPLDTKKKIFTMQEVQSKAAQRHMKPEDVIKAIQAAGHLVAQ